MENSLNKIVFVLNGLLNNHFSLFTHSLQDPQGAIRIWGAGLVYVHCTMYVHCTDYSTLYLYMYNFFTCLVVYSAILYVRGLQRDVVYLG